MTSSLTWNGSNGRYDDPTGWTPTGVPQIGDFAEISSGTVTASDSRIDSRISVNASASAAGTLILSNVVVGNDISTYAQNSGASSPQPVIEVLGSVAIEILGVLGAATILFDGTLTNSRVIELDNSPARLQPIRAGATAVLINNETLSIGGQFSQAQRAVLDVSVGGTGTIGVQQYGFVEFTGSVGSGQQLKLGGADGPASVQIDQPGAFDATITQLTQADRLIVKTPFTGATYTSTGTTFFGMPTGTLTLYDGSAVTGSLKLQGVYSLGTFTFNYASNGGTDPMLTISTRVVDPLTGALDTTTATGPIFRFFDTTNGAHLYTSDVGERSTILQTRPDLVEEISNFGSTFINSKGVTLVYRFFDSNNGTQFFTTSVGEVNTLMETRPDLVFERTSTLLEHSIAQPGDVAVYRFFDTHTGSHFYTGDVDEYRNLTNSANPALYRPDLVFETTAFYAPKGTFV